jgi:hypothetical protein
VWGVGGFSCQQQQEQEQVVNDMHARGRAQLSFGLRVSAWLSKPILIPAVFEAPAHRRRSEAGERAGDILEHRRYDDVHVAMEPAGEAIDRTALLLAVSAQQGRETMKG